MEEFLNEHLWSLTHWPFYAIAVIYMLVTQVTKSSLWTKKRAYTKSKWQWFWWWAYKSLPLQPVLAGALTGLIWDKPEPEVYGAAAVFYFAFSGAVSVWLYQILKGIAKKRGIDLGTLPGQDRVTPVDRPT